MHTTRLLLSTLAMTSLGFAQEAATPGPGLKFSGFLNYRMEYTEHPRVTASQAGDAQNTDLGTAGVDAKNESITKLWLNVDNQFDGNTRFHAIIAADSLGGRTTTPYVKVWEAFAEAKFGPGTVAVGRFLSDVGMGTLGGAPFMDGAHATLGNAFIKAQVYVTKFGNPGQTGDYNVADKSSYTFLSGDIKLVPVKGLTLSAAYFGDLTTVDPAASMIGGTLYKSWAAGAEYQFGQDPIPLVTLSGEYAENAGAMARKINGTVAPYAVADCTEGSDPRAYYAKAKLLGAKPTRPGTFGFSVQYRKADAGFDAMGMANPHTWNAPFNWTTPSMGGIADNEKGFELAAEVTVLPRCIISVQYGIMTLVNTTSTLDLASPALAVVNSVTPTNSAPVVSMVNGGQNRTNQNYVTANVHYIF
jgi:hypothetical protein